MRNPERVTPNESIVVDVVEMIKRALDDLRDICEHADVDWRSAYAEIQRSITEKMGR